MLPAGTVGRVRSIQVHGRPVERSDPGRRTAVGLVGSEPLAATSAPLQAAARSLPRPWVATAVSIGGVTAMLGVVLSQLLGLSRMVFAMARRGGSAVEPCAARTA